MSTSLTNFPQFSPPPPPPSFPNPHPRVTPPLPHMVTPPPLTSDITPPPPSPLASSSPDDGPTTIVIIFISFGGVLFLAFLAATLCCFIKKKKKKKKETVQETEITHVDEHLKVKEAIVPGPHGAQAVVLEVEDDVHIEEEKWKNEKVVDAMHVKSGDKPSTVLEEGASTSSPTHHHMEHKP